MAGHSTSARGFGFFDISVDLSKEGFENVDEIIKIIFQVNDYGPGGCVVSYNNQEILSFPITVHQHVERK